MNAELIIKAQYLPYNKEGVKELACLWCSSD